MPQTRLRQLPQLQVWQLLHWSPWSCPLPLSSTYTSIVTYDVEGAQLWQQLWSPRSYNDHWFSGLYLLQHCYLSCWESSNIYEHYEEEMNAHPATAADRHLLPPDLGNKFGQFHAFWDSPGNFLLSKSERCNFYFVWAVPIPTHLFLEVGLRNKWEFFCSPPPPTYYRHPNPMLSSIQRIIWYRNWCR